MSLNYIISLFKNGSVCVTGMKGTGKDVLFGNVIARRKMPYVSNLNYGGEFYNLRLDLLDMGGNTYQDFISDRLNEYKHPYIKGADIYISDVGVYLPSQYCNDLNRKYPFLPTYVALARQVSRNNVHFNVQSLNRAWDKFREQSDTYIKCNWCHVLFGKLVIQSVTVYDKYESCVSRVKPCRIRIPLLCFGERRDRIEMYLDNFYNTHGSVKDYLLVYFNLSEHNTYEFEQKLNVSYPCIEGGDIVEINSEDS